MRDLLQPFGLCFFQEENDLVVSGRDFTFSPDKTIERYNEYSWKIVPGPWPQEPVDALPSFAALVTSNSRIGTEVQIINYMFEDGLRYGHCFKDLGVPIAEQNMMMSVKGYQSSIVHAEVTAPDVIEGVRAVLWLALSLPKGSRVLIRNWQPILRRNPEIINILQYLGANIHIVEI